MGTLFELGELEDFLRDPQFDTAAGTVARRWASGWLKAPTGLTDWPVPVPDDIWAWGIELGAIAYRNPVGASSLAIDDFNISFDADRRAVILAAATAAYGGSSSPRYSFPAADWHWESVPALDPLTD